MLMLHKIKAPVPGGLYNGVGDVPIGPFILFHWMVMKVHRVWLAYQPQAKMWTQRA